MTNWSNFIHRLSLFPKLFSKMYSKLENKKILNFDFVKHQKSF